LVGTNETIELGIYKKERNGGVVTIRVYSMEVIKILEDFPEKKYRKRKWFSVEDAVKTVDVPQLAEIIKTLPQKIK